MAKCIATAETWMSNDRKHKSTCACDRIFMSYTPNAFFVVAIVDFH